MLKLWLHMRQNKKVGVCAKVWQRQGQLRKLLRFDGGAGRDGKTWIATKHRRGPLALSSRERFASENRARFCWGSFANSVARYLQLNAARFLDWDEDLKAVVLKTDRSHCMGTLGISLSVMNV